MTETEEKLNELHKRVAVAMKHFPSLRYGQATFNEAANLFPEKTEALRGTEDDCFYDDSKVPAFLKHFTLD